MISASVHRCVRAALGGFSATSQPAALASACQGLRKMLLRPPHRSVHAGACSQTGSHMSDNDPASLAYHKEKVGSYAVEGGGCVQSGQGPLRGRGGAEMPKPNK